MTNEYIAQQIFNEMMKHQPTNAVQSLKKLGAKQCGLYAVSMVIDTVRFLPYFKDELNKEVEKWEDVHKKLMKI